MFIWINIFLATDPEVVTVWDWLGIIAFFAIATGLLLLSYFGSKWHIYGTKWQNKQIAKKEAKKARSAYSVDTTNFEELSPEEQLKIQIQDEKSLAQPKQLTKKEIKAAKIAEKEQLKLEEKEQLKLEEETKKEVIDSDSSNINNN